MTCASCAARVEKKLNKMPGVTATVNYSTEKATIQLPVSLTLNDAIATIEATGYTASPVTAEAAESNEEHSLRIRLLVSTALTIPVVLLAMIPVLQFNYWQWVSLVLATPVVVWGALPFHRATLLNLRHGNTTMDTLISLGVSAAYLWSLYALFFGGAGDPAMRMEFSLLPSHNGAASEVYFEVASAVTVFLLLGRYLEVRAKARSSQALTALLHLGVKEVSVLRDNHEQTVPIAFLRVGDLFTVRPGERIATDGVVVEGLSAVDASMITGEPIPVDVEPGSAVVGSTVNENGRLVVQATAIGSDTALARITSMVEQAQAGKAPVQRLADRVSTIFVPVVLGLSLVTLMGWLVFGSSVTFAFTAAVAVLIIACPCALGLATPTALMVGTGRGAQLGILIRGPQILESTQRVNTIVVDKTGTVTSGRMSVHAVHPVHDTPATDLIQLAAALESASEHPVARAILQEVSPESELPDISDFLAIRGGGVQATINGDRAIAGSPRWVEEQIGTPIAHPWVDQQQSDGMTVIAVARNSKLLGFLSIADTVKPDSRAAVTRFIQLGLTPILLTGDNSRAADSVAREVGIDRVFAEVLPEDKVAVITQLQSEGHVVAMVGDGVNDAAALVQADLGMSMGSGTDVAIEASDITLVNSNLTSAATGIELARKTLGTIKGNLFWAFAYNVAAIPLAMAGLLNPMIAGAAMAFSSVFVVTNSLRLRRFHSSASA
ncbi:MAG: heavy metal translocating P-type ATPase [Candidatus Nanopelagicales bacterium]|nr:heavy metal translocating P-type ATPase [Candidatus Nanopelagicales bacterium]